MGLRVRDDPAVLARRAQRSGRPRRLSIIVGTCAAVAVSIGVLLLLTVDASGHGRACEPATGPPNVRWKTFSNGLFGFKVDYCSAWNADYFEIDSSFSSSIAFFSTEHMTDPCDHGGMGVTECSSVVPIGGLPPDGLVIWWVERSFPGVSDPLDLAPGKPTRIDALPAKIAVSPASEFCNGLGGAISVEATIQTRIDYFTMSACIGPRNEDLKYVLRALRGVALG